jgi:uncharacterized heparinase superfamily protein
VTDSGRITGIGAFDRLAARLSRFARPARGFALPPEPRGLGSFARGRQLSGGTFLLAGALVEAPGRAPWDIAPPTQAFVEALHAFFWLDDLAAVADLPAQARAQEWTFDWIARYATGARTGTGPGWRPDLTGARLMRMIHHGPFLLENRPGADRATYFAALGAQTAFLARRAPNVAGTGARAVALAALIRASVSLERMGRHAAPAADALARLAGHEVGPDGAIASRNPEELLDLLSLLTRSAEGLAEAGRPVPLPITEAIARIAPTLRLLRLADGGLARFQGGSAGAAGRLDRALADAGGAHKTPRGPAMGYLRLSGGRSTLVMDVAAPGRGIEGAHASTLAFEMTSGRRPLIVNCGSGRTFGPEWERAGRATPLQSTLGVRGVSSSRLKRGGTPGPGTPFAEWPAQVWAQDESTLDGARVLAGHDGYGPTHGLSHLRELVLSLDGRRLAGEDTLGALTADERDLRDRLRAQGAPPVTFDIRFHLHPDVDAALDLGGTAVSLALKSGEIWIFRHDGVGRLALEPSVYFDPARPDPRPSRQIVLTATVEDQATQLGWTLAKAQDTPTAIRDIAPDEAPG